MIKSRWLAIAGASLLCFGTFWGASAQAADEGPSFALYCRGPLNTFRTDSGKVIKTPFKWAKEAATKENPEAGECAWADRAPQGNEKPGADSTMVGNLGPFDSLPVRTFGKICVTRPASGNELSVRQVVRQLGHQTAPFHLPPFTAEGC